MNKLLLTTLVTVAASSHAFAGHEVKEAKQYTAPAEPCFRDQEFQLDLFGTYTETGHNALRPGDQDGFGGGLGLNYFFIRYVGLGIDGHFHSDDADVWDATARLIVRFPIETGSVCIAPYIFGGGGWEWAGNDDSGTLHAGGGLEFRITPKFGVFGEGRYTWVGFNGNGYGIDAAQARLGVRLAF